MVLGKGYGCGAKASLPLYAARFRSEKRPQGPGKASLNPQPLSRVQFGTKLRRLRWSRSLAQYPVRRRKFHSGSLLAVAILGRHLFLSFFPSSGDWMYSA